MLPTPWRRRRGLAELAKMRAAVRPVYDKFSAAYDPAIVTLFKAELERVSKL